MKELLIVILNYNTTSLTLDCLKSIYDSNEDLRFDVVLVDNGSSDKDLLQTAKKKYKDIIIIDSPKNLGFAGGNNLAIKKLYSHYNYTLLLNSDTVVKDYTITKLVQKARKVSADISSPRLVYFDNNFQPNAGMLPTLKTVFVWLSGIDDIARLFSLRIPSYQERNLQFYNDDRMVGWVSGTALLVKKEVIDKIGYLDEKIFMYAEDVDYCLRANKVGFKVWWFKDPTLIHLGGGSSDSHKYNQWWGEFRGLVYLFEKHYSKIKSQVLRILIKIFTFGRSVAFWFLGKKEYAKDYFKISEQI